MNAIHGGKSKDDKIDSKKIAQLLRGGNRRAKSTNYADRRGFAQLRSHGSRSALCPTPPSGSSRHFETPAEGTR